MRTPASPNVRVRVRGASFSSAYLAAAGFRVLADLARRSQVLFFTHHEHLVKVATDAVGRENLLIHEL
ncbi:MAG: hypothetical protein LH467_07670 [Gemmatimonadaceae bacterium]|nr:hypothetical protein [Gemmatimonadaceae bacterium]